MEFTCKFQKKKKLEKRFRSIRYCDLNNLVTPLPRSLTKIQQTQNNSQQLVYKCEEKEPRYPSGSLKIADHVDPPIPEDLPWNIIEEPREGEDTFIETILAQVRKGKSFTTLGAPGVGKTWVIQRVKEELEAQGERVISSFGSHACRSTADRWNHDPQLCMPIRYAREF